MKSFAGTEVILTVGVIIAIGVSLVQLRGIFYGQQILAQEEVVIAFAKDLESIIDKAIGTTGDATFVYYPMIKKYSVDISNNLISIHDKVSKKNASFSKSSPQIIDNSFEDCEKIFVSKIKEKILITCKCKEIGEDCKDSLICCSGYCSEASGKCEMPPICPKQLRCPGAPTTGGPGNHAWIDINGDRCCPLENIGDISGPVCDKNHCCPTHKPKWCPQPVEGGPRCMSEEDYRDPNKCRPIRVYHLVFVPIGYGDDYDSFRNDVERSFEFFLQRIPLRECPDARSRIQAHIVRPGETPECQISSCSFICSDCNSRALACVNSIPRLRAIVNKVAALCKGNTCPGACGCANGIPGTASSTNMRPCRGVLYEIPTHEIGHTMGLGHVNCDVPCHACPPYANNCNCPDCGRPLVEKREFIMDYCYPMGRFGPAAYQCLKDGEFKNYMC